MNYIDYYDNSLNSGGELSGKGCKGLLRREKNKIAARKCRQRKQQTLIALEQEVQQLQQDKTALENEVKLLQGTYDHVSKERQALYEVAHRVGLLEQVQQRLREELDKQYDNKSNQAQSESKDSSIESCDTGIQGPPGLVTTGIFKHANKRPLNVDVEAEFQPIKMSKPAVITNYSYVAKFQTDPDTIELNRSEFGSGDSNDLEECMDDDDLDLLQLI